MIQSKQYILMKFLPKKVVFCMKIAALGVWHVHAGGYTRNAMDLGDVIGFYERDDVLAESFNEEFNLHRFATVEELLESDAEAVIVCSATSDHTDDIIKIANAKKHIFTEKVLALSDEDCEKIEKAVKDNGVNFAISLVQKYRGAPLAVKAIVDSGELGKVNYARFRNCHSGSLEPWLPQHFYSLSQCGGGAMIDLGAHGMYLINWLLGMPVSAKSVFTVSCSETNPKGKNVDNIEDNAVTVMQFPNGAIAVNETGFVSRCEPAVLEVHGENGYVYMESGKVFKCTTSTNGERVDVPVKETLPMPIEQLLTGKLLPGCSLEDAKALTHMMVMAYKDV